MTTKKEFAGELGKRLKVIRGARSLRAFSSQLGIGWNTLLRYERGGHIPDAWLLLRLQDDYGVDPRWLLSGYGAPPPPPAATGERNAAWCLLVPFK